MNIEIKKKLTILELGDLVTVIESQEKDLSLSNLNYNERLGGGTQANSIMDRIIHNSYTIPTSDKNLRKIYDSEKAKHIIRQLEN